MNGSSDRTLLLSRADSVGLVGWRDLLPVVSDSFVALATGEAQLFPAVRESLPAGTLGLRGGVWPARGLFGVKVSAFFPSNRELGLDNHQALVVLLDPATGRPTAIVDGNHVTWIRTAIAGLAGTIALARPDARRVLVVGNGLQAEAQIRSHAWGLAERYPEFAVHAPRDSPEGKKARHFVERLAAHAIRVVPAPSIEEALADAEIVITATPARTPLVGGASIRPGTHVSAVGADAPGKRELEDALIRRARLVADDRTQSARYGEGQALGDVEQEEIPTLGEVLAGKAVGRRGEDEITIFDSTGLGLHDVATADVVRTAALRAGLGAWISL